MGLEADRGGEMSPATLQSPIMKEASSTCTLQFYLNMHGEGMFYNRMSAGTEIYEI